VIRDGESSSTSKPMACSGGSSSPALATEPFSAGSRRVASSVPRATCRFAEGWLGRAGSCRGKVRVEWNLWVALRGLPELPLPLTDRLPHWDCRVSRLSSSPNSHLWPGQARVVARWFLVTAAGTNQPEPCGLLSDWRPGPG